MEILINPPKKISVTKEEFNNFTYYDLACFWCNWKVAFCFDEYDNIDMFTGKEDICERCMKNHRFKDIIWYNISKAEMFTCKIKKENKLYEFIINKLGYLIMK
jgi:hypothetical protein